MSTLTLNDIITFIKEHDDIFNKVDNDVEISNTFTILELNDYKQFPKIETKLFNNLNDILNKLKYCGSIIYFNEINISLYYSVLYCLDINFKLKIYDNQVNLIKELNETLKTNLNKLYNKFNYKLTKPEISSHLKNFSYNDNIIDLLSDFFAINIWVLNINEDSIYLSNNTRYNKFRINIVLSLFNDVFQPVYYKVNTIFNDKNKIIKCLQNITKINKKIDLFKMWENDVTNLFDYNLLVIFNEFNKKKNKVKSKIKNRICETE